jgi:hypothetical protein
MAHGSPIASNATALTLRIGFLSAPQTPQFVETPLAAVHTRHERD